MLIKQIITDTLGWILPKKTTNFGDFPEIWTHKAKLVPSWCQVGANLVPIWCLFGTHLGQKLPTGNGRNPEYQSLVIAKTTACDR